jgi:hypothetical protein
MVKRGIMSLVINDNVVVTDLAYEKAKRLGMSLVSQTSDQPPAAPVRPYISKNTSPIPALKPAPKPSVFELQPAPVSTSLPGQPVMIKLPEVPSKAVVSQDPSKYAGLTSLADVSSQNSQTPAGYPVLRSVEPSMSSTELRKRVRDAVMARQGKVDAALLDAIIDRVLNSMGIQ